MELLLAAFVAGILTIAAPCILPLLPIIIGGSAVAGSIEQTHRWRRPLVITGSLAVSIIAFTLLLKATTALLGVPQEIWSLIAGGIVLLFGLNLVFPEAWETLMLKTGLQQKSNALLGATSSKQGWSRDVMMGAALGPVFSSCSPTYALIVAVILPRSFAEGLLCLIAYAVGLSAALLIIAFAGQSLVQKLGWLSNPHGWFRRIVGILFITVGLMVIFGLDKKLQAYVLEQGWYDPIMKVEEQLQP